MCKFPSFECLSNHWKSKIVVQALPLFEKATEIVTGMYFDPVEYLPRYMEHWLERRELEGSPLATGFYKVKFKVIKGDSWTIKQTTVYFCLLFQYSLVSVCIIYSSLV